jgi:putative two-component system response regulator
MNIDRKKVMVVDDNPQNVSLLVEFLRDDYTLIIANNGKRALDILASGNHPDLILLDIMMPVMDGYEVLKHIKEDPLTTHIPVIFATAKADVADEAYGLSLGAADYISKPINPDLLCARVATHLRLKNVENALRDRAKTLEEEVMKRTREIRTFQDVTVRAMASLAETRDNETGNHILRTQNYVKILAEKLANRPKYHGILSTEYIKKLYISAPLHDIGKVGIPDNILLKPGKLTFDEFEIMKQHTTIGYESIVRAEESVGSKLEFLDCAKEISLSHQEKWDGSGYPQSLKGEEIPLSARLMAIADVYDALINKRVYKCAMPHEEALEIMKDGRGTHFDPEIFDDFLNIESEFFAIAQKYKD